MPAGELDAGAVLVGPEVGHRVYNAAAPYHWYLRWGAVLFVAVIAGGGFAYYWFVQRHRTGVLAEHRSQAPDTPPVVTPAAE